MRRITRNDILIKLVEAIDIAFPDIAPVVLDRHKPQDASFGETGYNFYTGKGLHRLWWFATIKGLMITLTVYSRWNGSKTCIDDWWSSICIHHCGNFVKVLLALQNHARIGQHLGLGGLDYPEEDDE